MANPCSKIKSCGCGLPTKVPVRLPLEEKLEEDRRRVRFAHRELDDHMPRPVEQKDPTSTSSYQKPSEVSKMEVTPVEQRAPYDQFTVGLKGYGQPYQHPAWTTSQSVYGRYAPPPGLNQVRRPRDTSFTNRQGLGGMGTDGNFTTSTETEYLYKPSRKN